MKKYSNYQHASISMSSDPEFLNGVEKIFNEIGVGAILESGTFLGLGSTTVLANQVIKSKSEFPNFFTLEIDIDFFLKARKNLKSFPFVKVLYGISVDLNEAIKFMETDDCILNHQNYPDIFIDVEDNPKEFYINEIKGKLSGSRLNTWGKIKRWLKLGTAGEFKENLFSTIIPKIRDKKPLILLDSCGGIGYMEFLKVIELMKDKSFSIILDDVHHIKHFRSLQYLKDSKNGFKIIAEDLEKGWVIAYK